MIDLQTLTISNGKKVLVDSVNAEFAPGTVYGLVAPNGHGKTTLLRAMAGLPGPRVDGSIVLDEVQGTGAREVRSMIFYAPGEGTLLYPGLRAEDHLKMVCDMWPHARDIEEIVEQTQIGEFAKMRIRTLSQGMKQQLTLAIAYATGTRSTPAGWTCIPRFSGSWPILVRASSCHPTSWIRSIGCAMRFCF